MDDMDIPTTNASATIVDTMDDNTHPSIDDDEVYDSFYHEELERQSDVLLCDQKVDLKISHYLRGNYDSHLETLLHEIPHHQGLHLGSRHHHREAWNSFLLRDGWCTLTKENIPRNSGK
jgi:hypothetical protein